MSQSEKIETDGRAILKKSADWIVKLIASIFAMSWASLVVFPLTIFGLLILIVILVAAILIYRKRATLFAVLSLLAIGGILTISANLISIRFHDGPVYLFPCETTSISCIRPLTHQTFGKTALIVPVWSYKIPITEWALGEKREVYLPTVIQDRSGVLIHAPLEEDYNFARPRLPSDKRHYLTFTSKSPAASLGINPNKSKGKLGLELGLTTSLKELLIFETRLSKSRAGQFSVRDTSAGPELWRRVVVSNEFMRELYTDDQQKILQELEIEYERTGLIEDRLRFDVYSIWVDRHRFGGHFGVSQRHQTIRRAIQAYARDASPDELNGQWLDTFVIHAGSAFQELAELEVSQNPGNREPKGFTFEEIIVSQPAWKSELNWLSEKYEARNPIQSSTESIAGTLNTTIERFADSFSEREFDAHSWFDELTAEHVTAEENYAQDLLKKSPDEFAESLELWLAGTDEQEKARRFEIIAGAFRNQQAKIILDALVALSSMTKQNPGKSQSDASVASSLKILMGEQSLRKLDEQVLVLEKNSVTGLQSVRIEIDRINLIETSQIFAGLLETISNDGQGKVDPKEQLKLLGLVGVSDLLVVMAGLQSGTAEYEEAKTEIATLLADPNRYGPFSEVGLAVAPLVVLDGAIDGGLAKEEFQELCARAEQFSLSLRKPKANIEGATLNESALLLADVCQQEWGNRHEGTLYGQGIMPTRWVKFVRQGIRRRQAESAD